MSRDLDFVLDYHMFDPKPSDAPIRQLGFVRENSMYRHPTCPFTLEFLSAPLAVGNDVITTWDTLKEGDLALHIINPTDCVRDRLSGFIYYSDFSSLRQAVDVALIQAVDFSIIEKWCRSENALTAYEEFLVELKRAGTES